MSDTTFQLQPTDGSAHTGRVVSEENELIASLLALSPDLTLEIFINAMQAGLAARNTAIPASPKTKAGISHWQESVEMLRLLLSERAWNIVDKKNCPLILSPDKSIALVVMTGDSRTGLDGGIAPTNSAEKGAVAKELIEANQLSLKLAQNPDPGTQVWVLLYHYDKATGMLRFELSLPSSFNKGKITGWTERILLGSISNATAVPVTLEESAVESAIVNVTPKTGAR